MNLDARLAARPGLYLIGIQVLWCLVPIIFWPGGLFLLPLFAPAAYLLNKAKGRVVGRPIAGTVAAWAMPLLGLIEAAIVATRAGEAVPLLRDLPVTPRAGVFALPMLAAFGAAAISVLKLIGFSIILPDPRSPPGRFGAPKKL